MIRFIIYDEDLIRTSLNESQLEVLDIQCNSLVNNTLPFAHSYKIYHTAFL